MGEDTPKSGELITGIPEDTTIGWSHTWAISVQSGYAGIDEVAEALGVGAPKDSPGVVIEGRSGTSYSLTEMLLKLIALMREAIEASKKEGQ